MIAVAVSEVKYDEIIDEPGAKRSTHVPKFENEVLESLGTVAPTVMACGARAGELRQASAFFGDPWLRAEGGAHGAGAGGEGQGGSVDGSPRQLGGQVFGRAVRGGTNGSRPDGANSPAMMLAARSANRSW